MKLNLDVFSHICQSVISTVIITILIILEFVVQYHSRMIENWTKMVFNSNPHFCTVQCSMAWPTVIDTLILQWLQILWNLFLRKMFRISKLTLRFKWEKLIQQDYKVVQINKI